MNTFVEQILGRRGKARSTALAALDKEQSTQIDRIKVALDRQRSAVARLARTAVVSSAPKKRVKRDGAAST